jgi:alpha-L-arabinofuranosidase
MALTRYLISLIFHIFWHGIVMGGHFYFTPDEWNLRGWHHPVLGDFRKEMDYSARNKNDINSTYTMADALFSACFLNSCLRNARDVEIACFSPVVNARGAIYVHPKGIVKRTTFLYCQS